MSGTAAYDMIVRNGLVVDGTGLPRRRERDPGLVDRHRQRCFGSSPAANRSFKSSV